MEEGDTTYITIGVTIIVAGNRVSYNEEDMKFSNVIRDFYIGNHIQ